MRKLGVFILGAGLSFSMIVTSSGLLNNSKYIVAEAATEKKMVYIGGMAAGFTLKAGGVQIIGLCEVMTDEGICAPALKNGLRIGDKITTVNNIKIESIGELNEILNKSKGEQVSLEVVRADNIICINLKPVKDKTTDSYKIGVLAKDNISGIGTITYIEKDTHNFGALGHSVVGEDKKELSISNGMVFECNIIGINKGVRGKAGELRGMFLSDKCVGVAHKLCDCGIFGTISDDNMLNLLSTVWADSSDSKPGAAYIYSTVNGVCPEKYQIEIVKVDRFNHDNKDYVIKITDEKLLDLTGGIVQGMSGSPIIQEGKMIGAITHVFLNDPTRGYAINIETMLNQQ